MSSNKSVYIYKLTVFHLLTLHRLCAYEIIYVTRTEERKAAAVNRLLALFSVLVPWREFPRVRQVPAGDDVPSFAELYVDSRSTVTEVLIDESAGQFASHLAETYTEQGARSFYANGIAYYGSLFQFVTDVYKLRATDGGVTYQLKPCHRSYDLDIEDCTEHQPHPAYRLYLRYKTAERFVHLLLFGCSYPPYYWHSLPVYRFGRYLRRPMLRKGLLSRLFGRRRPSTDSDSFTLATEVGNPEYMDGQAGQPDFLVGDDGIPDADTIYYKTSHPANDANDPDMSHVEAEVSNFVDLRDAGISLRTAVEVCRCFLTHNYQSVAELGLALHAAELHFEFGTLFETFDIEYNLAPTFTNDKRKVRMDSGLLTSLAELHGVTNIDYQTRPFVHPTFEYGYNHHHKLYVWHRNWVADERLFGLESDVVPVGNPFAVATSDQDEPDSDENVISLFTGGVASETARTFQYNWHLVSAFVDLARQYPDERFILKPKTADEKERYVVELDSTPENIQISGSIYETDDLIERSKIVVALAFTSPGIDAMMRGKQTIIYSEFDDGVIGPLAGSPAVCQSRSELFERFRTSLDDDPQDGPRTDELSDETADGTARERILRDLVNS